MSEGLSWNSLAALGLYFKESLICAFCEDGVKETVELLVSSALFSAFSLNKTKKKWLVQQQPVHVQHVPCLPRHRQGKRLIVSVIGVRQSGWVAWALNGPIRVV